MRQATISKLERGEPATQLVTMLDALSAPGMEIIIDRRGEVAISTYFVDNQTRSPEGEVSTVRAFESEPIRISG